MARANARGAGTAGTPDPKDESGTKAPPRSATNVPYERTRAPESEPSRPRTIAELCSTKDFVEWVTAVADFQALVEPEVHGVLQAAEFGAVWRSRIETLAKIPMIMCDLPRVPLRDKEVSWEILLTGKVGGAPHNRHHHQVSKPGRPGRPEGGTCPPQGHTLGGRPPCLSPARHPSVIFQARTSSSSH